MLKKALEYFFPLERVTKKRAADEFVYELFGLCPRNPARDIAENIGNFLVTGIPNQGPSLVYNNLIYDSLEKKRMLIVIDGKQTKAEMDDMISSLTKYMAGGRLAFLFNNGKESDGLNALSAFSSIEERSIYIAMMLTLQGIEPAEFEKVKTYYAYMMQILEYRREEYNLVKLFGIDPKMLDSYIDEDPRCVGYDAKGAKIFLNKIRDMYADKIVAAKHIYLSDRFEKMFNNKKYKAEDIVRPGNALVISSGAVGIETTTGMREYAEKERYKLVYLLTSLVNCCIQKYAREFPVLIILRHCDFLPEVIITDLQRLNEAGYPVSVAWFPDDICEYVKNNGNDVLKASACRAVFNTGSSLENEFWEKEFGSKEKVEISTTVTPKRRLLGLSSYISPGSFIPSVGRKGEVSYTMHKERKPQCNAQEFAMLAKGEALCHYVKHGRYQRIRIVESGK